MSCNYCIGLILLSIIVVVILSFLNFFRFCLILEWNLLGRGGERIRRIQEEKQLSCIITFWSCFPQRDMR